MKEVNIGEIFGEQRELGFDEVGITVASPESVRSWSKGEVKNPETINYRTFKPEKGGLFCERIFGPTRDWECSCGKYKRIKHKGVVCDRCGVEVTLSRVRRERMGHIDLAVPVSHIWFYKCMPSRIGLMLDMTSRQLERVIYYEDYIVIDPGSTPLQRCQLLTEGEFREAEDQYGDDFVAGMGAEAIQKLLEQTDLQNLHDEIEQQMTATRSKQLRKKLAKRLKLVQGFMTSKTRPEWMILNVLPVIPPDLRPLVPLEGGRFATSDLNDLYRRVINRNNRLKTLLQLKTPEVIIRNEKRMLQEAVDALFDNGRHGRAVTGAANRPLKSLSDMLKGKGGRFRQNLLGKRVDYSGRSVIVIGPELKLNQCGLPKKMALVLFEPFIIRRLKEQGHVHTVRSAKKLIERQTPEVWDILEEVTKGHPVLLNRAPTLHRLSIQAFEPQLIEGEAIRIHPLVCTAYNADFDGDQMAVHVPLSVEAQMEARMLMLAPNNIFSPSSGKPITTPSQDIPLGCYYLTQTPRGEKGENRLPLFANAAEVELALSEGAVVTHTRIRYKNPNFGGKPTVYGNTETKILETTAGRVIFNEIWPPELGFYNKVCGKKQLSDIIWRCYKAVGQQRTVETLDRLKEMGFRSATKAGISIGITDMIIPKEKSAQLEKAYREIAEVEKQYRRGIITDGERKNKVQDIWTHTGEELANALFRTLEFNDGRKDMNPVFMMVDSGARGNRTQVKQLAGMRGLMAKPSGEIIETPIISNFREGLSVLEYFISTHGARKGLADTALKTADSGYLTRKLVDAAQDVIITQDDCGTINGIIVRPIYEGDEEVVSLSTRIIGRTSCETVKDPVSGQSILKSGQIIDEETAAALEKIGLEQLKIRSALTCESRRGICAKCYGRNLATGNIVKLGEAVGIIAAQSIGEPGTQLTMRTFHVGGTASQTFKQPIIKAKNDGMVRFNELKVVETTENNYVVLNKNGTVSVHSKDGRELESYNIVVGSVIAIADGASVKKGETFIQWDPYNVPIITEKGGKVEFRDMIPGVTVRKEVDEATGVMGTVVIEHKEDLHPQIVIVDDAKEVLASYSIPAGAHIEVKENGKISAGTRLARTPRKIAKTKDITGGLPRVAELFEARRPKDAAEIAKIDGIVDIGGTVRGKRRLLVRDQATGAEEEHLIPLAKHIIVFKGDFVKKGQQLTEGPVVPHEILEVCGPQELQEHLLNEVQEVYRLQGVEINDKHIEIIVRQMLRKVKITDPGDTSLLWGDQVDRLEFDAENERVVEKGGKPAEASPVLLGITKASLETDSFISAASFQDTTRVLTEAATLGKVDRLRGFKENVIMGHLIPAGTGFPTNREIDIVHIGDALQTDPEPQQAAS
ncbi:MAG: DNA-directed RNA polymerase subunit beta' [Verrucomicrobia bacterium 61-8]|nr:DNA-directed RNA polymerase subunit beta' [Verrucomicrobiota bacterium]OJV03105.1 MAG: DNA-directed RNA polymerase subunit beta' [Verrucomicrobia bacterium 61-8]